MKSLKAIPRLKLCAKEERVGCNAAKDAGGQRKKTWQLVGPEEVEKEE